MVLLELGGGRGCVGGLLFYRFGVGFRCRIRFFVSERDLVLLIFYLGVVVLIMLYIDFFWKFLLVV